MARIVLSMIAGAAMTMLTAVPGAADNVGDNRLGQSIAEKDCAQCHALGGRKAPAGAEAPSFEVIANMESATVLSIRVWLRTSHRNKTMPNIILSEEEVDALATYILSLRTK